MKTKSKEIQLATIEDEPRVDSRQIAERLGIEHKHLMETIRKYEADISEFGLLPFQTEKVPIGRPESFALLNEDQSIFTLTLSRNTPVVVSLKKELVKKFRQYYKAYLGEIRSERRKLQTAHNEAQLQARQEGKVDRRSITDAIQAIKQLADEQNPNNNAERYFKQFTSLIYKLLFNIKKAPPGLRDELPASALRKLQMAECQAAEWVNEFVDQKVDYHLPYLRVKERVTALVEVIGSIDLSVPSAEATTN